MKVIGITNNVKISLRQAILLLRVGEFLQLDYDEVNLARRYASQLQWQYGRTWRVSIQHKHSIIWRSF